MSIPVGTCYYSGISEEIWKSFDNQQTRSCRKDSSRLACSLTLLPLLLYIYLLSLFLSGSIKFQGNAVKM